MKGGLIRPLLWVRSMARITSGENFSLMMRAETSWCQWRKCKYITHVINSLRA